ncbi:MAG: adenylate/guanylate cyclase domain-containing protein, partial [Mucilaginibacter sp.]
SADTVALSGGSVKLNATFLYADLAGSSVLAETCPWQTTAKIIRAYLDTCSRLIRAYGGEIRSFDGDRVMGIFKSNFSNIEAVNCAREIDWVVSNVLNPKAKAKFASIKNNNITIKHCIGIDSGEVVAVRTGIRNYNDLIWIGRPPSFAAKLSDIREYPFEVHISKTCYDALSANDKTDSSNNPIWENRTYKFAGTDQTVYRTKYFLEP